ncbi:MAG: 4Fe-4S binding protein [Methanomicrobiales archaeon]|nr:4Fe-4S binding protein [Methanomicrobiales archaeon]MDI6877199.1 4Fe-4S binding protein [Methanomicrobiales archaeon]
MKLLVKFSKRQIREPIIARLVRETGVLICIDRANIDSTSGEVLIDVPDKQADMLRERMEAMGAEVRVIEDSILRDEEECIDCGACISVCPRDVFSYDAEWHVRLREERCVLCGKCILACPHGALSQRV